MSCVVCGKEMTKEEQEPKPHNVCVSCFWKEVKNQRKKKYKSKFDLNSEFVTFGGEGRK